MKKYSGLLIFYFSIIEVLLFALPQEKQVLTGQVSFSEIGQQLQVTASDGAVISYAKGFDIGLGETVQFVQPSMAAKVLNQIYSDTPSQIDGNIKANGHVYLVNSAGIIFGENSVIEVGKLHAIAGSLSTSDFLLGVENYSSLSGSVENLGSIVAEEVVFAGSSIKNTGTILAENGIVVLAAGSGVQLFTENATLSVVLTESSGSSYGVLSDIAGQAVLQSGVVEASRAEFYGKTITATGTTVANKLILSDIDSVSGTQGSLLVSELSINGSVDFENAPTIDLSSTTHQIGQVSASGNFQSISIRSTGPLLIGESLKPVNFSSQFLDLRVANGELTMNSLPSPLYSSQENSILLATDEVLNLSYDLDQLTYSRMLLFGTNLTAANYQNIESKSENLYQLNSTSLSLDDLSFNFSSASLQKLITENPSFNGFSLEESSSLGLSSSNSQADSQSVDVVPSLSSFSSPSSSSFTLEGTKPSFSPISISSPSESSSSGVITSSVLELATSYGLFANYSYYLKAASTSESVTNIISASGGSSALFGGSYNLLSSNGPSQQSESGSESDQSESGGESDSASSNKEANKALQVAAKIKGAIPFAPIGLPTSSPEAGLILDNSLSNEIELILQKYLN